MSDRIEIERRDWERMKHVEWFVGLLSVIIILMIVGGFFALSWYSNRAPALFTQAYVDQQIAKALTACQAREVLRTLF